MRYLGMAVSDIPTWAGTEYGLSENTVLQAEGFASHLNLQRGEDDLFINETARAHNTRVEASPESLVRIAMPKYKRIWCEENKLCGYQPVISGTARYLMGFGDTADSCSIQPSSPL